MQAKKAPGFEAARRPAVYRATQRGQHLTGSYAPVYRATKVVILPCHTCNEPTEHAVDGEWATGETLSSGYTPPPDELVKNHVTKCNKCGDAQYS
ncbi:hypothetical protein CMI37_02785 [Candidatus Pacearchaeota archaeon]|nr:hypothetical protein [Candidatus Pacearchaeota archaeon]